MAGLTLRRAVGGLDEDRARTAEEELAAWRAKGALPFPDFEVGESERLQDTLDYPPEGSPDHELQARQAGMEEQQAPDMHDDRKNTG